ncbi:MAG: hypothetical protein R3C11_06575 [Planctomycetaceae bacterium]
MGYSIGYATTSPVFLKTFEAMEAVNHELYLQRTWLSCEPIYLHRKEDGYVTGSSKPTFVPDPEDAASAEAEGLPDGNVIDALNILAQLSSEFNVDWMIDDDYSEGPIGYIRDGVIDSSVKKHLSGIMAMAALEQEFEYEIMEADEPAGEDDDDQPHILKFPGT